MICLLSGSIRAALAAQRSYEAYFCPCLIKDQRSKIRRLIQPLRALRKNLAAGFGDSDRMFELGRERAVAGDGGPAVVEQFYVGAADVDHRLDGEDHARLELGAGAGAAG